MVYRIEYILFPETAPIWTNVLPRWKLFSHTRSLISKNNNDTINESID